MSGVPGGYNKWSNVLIDPLLINPIDMSTKDRVIG